MISTLALTDAELDDAAAHCRELVNLQVQQGDNSLTPWLIVKYRRGPDAPLETDINAILGGFNQAFEKHAALFTMGKRCYDERKLPCVWFLIAEAWTSTQVVGERRKYLLPEDDPDRKEVLLYHGQAIDGKQRHGVLPVQRDPANGLGLSAAGDWIIYPVDGLRAPLLSKFLHGYVSQLSPEIVRQIIGG